MDAVDDAGRRRISLYDGRIQYDLHVRIPSAGNVHDIPHRCARSCSHHPQSPDIPGNRLLILRREHAALLQFQFQPLVPLVKRTGTVQLYLSGIQLVFAVPLVDIHTAAHHDLLSFPHLKVHTVPVGSKHHTRYRAFCIL